MTEAARLESPVESSQDDETENPPVGIEACSRFSQSGLLLAVQEGHLARLIANMTIRSPLSGTTAPTSVDSGIFNYALIGLSSQKRQENSWRLSTCIGREADCTPKGTKGVRPTSGYSRRKLRGN